MGDRFDDAARNAGKGLTRRQAMRKFAAGVAGAIAATLLPGTAHARHCPDGAAHCGPTCCPEGTMCCKVQGSFFCCPRGKLVTIGCPSTIAGAISIGCIAV